MNPRLIAASIAAVAAVAVLGACSSSDDSTSGHEGHDMSATSQSTSASAKGSNNAADVMFAQMMLPHHEQALEMSDILLAKDGVPADVRELATTIKAAQGPEITQLNSWLTAWGAPKTADMSGHSMDGMVSPEDITKLKNAPGPEAAKLYLTQMIAHHEGAVAMAETQIDDGQNPDAVAMARSIVESQNAEIEQMKGMLGS
ncbi:Uncharacterized conserved protein, DUF305 family [Gordonia malaquae]|jgi:uncharacterized protein (DUF305 family)|uniref:DUF305 domain-containing protein n=1 Tax=Gordonia malaquae NBRC 108250 TaxID=1223542 RepID=M3VC49_GORML|nr:DUF305 domain-containing protein [Gordonia malaquae]GAC81393.1 hypothetical protein GM1_033_00330 [Gordonia malaquae NBRC 108250]SED74231.1 Uncharacterized conserved protein, DUF305 family [Gordonia malaquae]